MIIVNNNLSDLITSGYSLSVICFCKLAGLAEAYLIDLLHQACQTGGPRLYCRTLKLLELTNFNTHFDRKEFLNWRMFQSCAARTWF